MCQRVNRFGLSRFGLPRFGWLVIGAVAAGLLSGCSGGQAELSFYPGEEAYVVKSVKDDSVVDQTACAANDPSDTWTPNSVAAGRMYAMQYSQSDGAIGNPEQIEVGVGTLCFQFLNSNFTPFDTIKARGNLAINGFTVRFEGRCIFTNNSMPVSGIHQMSCALPLVGPLPKGYKGGLLTTNSVMNAGRVPGYSSGSILTLHMYQESGVAAGSNGTRAANSERIRSTQQVRDDRAS